MRIYLGFLLCLCSTTLCGQVADTSYARLLAVSGERAFNNGKYDSALIYYAEAAPIFGRAEEYVDQISCMNEWGDILTLTGQLEAGMTLLQETLALSTQKLGKVHVQTAVACNYLGTAYARLGDLDQSRSAYKEGLEIRLALFGEIHSAVAGSYINIGITYDDEGIYQKGIEYYQKGIEIMTALGKRVHRFTANGYQNIGGCYRATGEYDLALASFQQALSIKHNLYPVGHYSFADTYTSLGNCYHDRGDLAAALEQYDQAAIIYGKTLGHDHPRYGALLRNLGFFYKTDGQMGPARDAIERALVIYQNQYGPEHPRVADILNSMGELYAADDPAHALELYQQGIDILTKISHLQSEAYVTLQYNLGVIHRDMQEYDEAAECMEAALYALAPALTDPAQSAYRALNQPVHKNNLLSVLKGKGKLYRYRYAYQSKDPADLKTALLAYDLAAALIDSSRVSVGGLSRDTKEILSGKTSNIYEHAIETALELHTLSGNPEYLKSAYKFMEKNKFLTLYESMRETEAREFAGIPQQLLEQEEELRQQIAYYEQIVFEGHHDSESEDTLMIRRLEAKIATFSQEYRNVLNQLEQDFPEYYRIKYQVDIADPESIARQLPHDQAMIEYYLGDSTLFIVCFADRQYQFFSQPRTAELDQALQAIRSSITDRSAYQQNPNQADRTYREAAFLLFQELLEKPLAMVPDAVNSLLLIPDGTLGHIPFEILLTDLPEGNNYRNWPYLLQQYRVSYAYSGTLLLEQARQSNKPASKLFAGFAARYPADAYAMQDSVALGHSLISQLRSGGLPLPGARNEVEAISNIMQGDAFLGNRSSESHFKQVANEYAILHLAMHALTEDENPLYSRLLFTPDADTADDGFLHAAELYNMKLNAQLAVLSACNTGFGKLLQGEGLMSLSMAFSYAGCPSLIMSLWRVPDQATSAIMVAFYAGLKEGQAKDVALREAKLQYLTSVQAPELAHPYYWAGFIPSGDMSPIVRQQSYWEILLLVSLILAGIIGWKLTRS